MRRGEVQCNVTVCCKASGYSAMIAPIAAASFAGDSLTLLPGLGGLGLLGWLRKLKAPAV
jgi:hypothetical protein